MTAIVFTVHSVTNGTEVVSATVNGDEVQATVAAFEAELVSDHYGTLRLKFTGKEIDEAKAKFVVDEELTWVV
jgi:hypothetical protein